MSSLFSKPGLAEEVKPRVVPSQSPYDALTLYSAGSPPSDTAASLVAMVNTGELAGPALMDATAWLSLYFNTLQDPERSLVYYSQYSAVPNHEHDAAFEEDTYMTGCPDCSGQGRVAYDCPSCKGGKHAMAMSSSVRTCPGCNGAGFLKKTCPTCRGKGKVFSAKTANENLAAFTLRLLLLRAEPDPAAFTGRLRAENRDAFIKLYLASKTTPVPINGKVVRILDENTLLIRRIRENPLVICLRAKAHSYTPGGTVQTIGYAVEPYSFPDRPAPQIECYSTDPVHGAVVVIGLDALALLYEARDRQDSTPPAALPAGGDPPNPEK